MVSDQPSHHQAASLKGHFLIATPVIGSGFFNRSLTYLCDHGSEGAMGIVVNQCLEVGLADMLSHLEIDAVISCPDRPFSREGRLRPIMALCCIAVVQTGKVASRSPMKSV